MRPRGMRQRPEVPHARRPISGGVCALVGETLAPPVGALTCLTPTRPSPTP